ncbi:hypothetical protein [Myceligenerans pegani]|uniref:Uncharacterized protein n=1 Tax=Myceligenerans pegani TaxID=2776917 RepID=A0ABR9N5C7_9MICO|nr:hypothetical protein [Myceligenerans sp. TRM 65318]MBE1878865.1 hypothetical protein [Myceligenerans sp. TRM 65318]MBE3021136.1 hypothetical protein [Myceligenerans sp. TRM 65318]
MSGLGRWSLWTGLGLVVVAVVCVALTLVPVGVIAGVLGVVALGIAGYDAIYNALDRAELRRRAARAERERGQGHRPGS